MQPAPAKSPPPNTIRYFLWFGTSFAIIIAIVLAVGQYYSITQFFVRLSLIIAAYFVTATLLKKFPPHPRPIAPADTQVPLTLRSLLPMGGGMLWFLVHTLILGYGNSGMRLFSQSLWQFSMMIGFMLIGTRLLTRVGDSLHCPHCEYPYTFDDADAPIRCPECGKGWLGILKKGRKKWHLKRTLVGLALMFLGLVVLNPIFYIGRLAPHLPTSLLFASSYLTPTNNHLAWDELATRQLSPYWTSVMAKRVLSLRNDNTNHPSSGWFEQTAAAGTMPPELRERFFVEGFQADLFLPDRAKVAEPFSATLRVTNVSSGDRTNPAIFFAGYYLDESHTAIGRVQETKWRFDLRPDSLKPYRECFVQPITITQKGEHKVRVVYWLAYLPSFHERLKWQPDGTPAPVPTALWSKRYEFSKTIRVE